MDSKKFEFRNFDYIIRFAIKNESEIKKMRSRDRRIFEKNRFYEIKTLTQNLSLSKELPNDEQDELENIQNENFENFEPYEPLRIPFECEHCSFFTTDSVLAAHHTDFHSDLTSQAKVISRWEPSTAFIRTSVIVANPRASVIVANPNCLV